MPRLSLLLSVFAAAVLLVSCGGTAVMKVTDIIQIRAVETEDQLAPKFENSDGEIIRLGDPILTDQTIISLLVRETAGTDSFELSIYMNDQGASRWRRIMRRKGEQMALVVQGRVRATFVATEPINKAGTQILIPAVATNKKDADALQEILDKKRSTK
ncbi:MAG: hypothetical protein HY962_13825 [Ignavibacteriae bacterium]|nr:hypothetical protein [Ignavibacteriota bacterium]